MSSSEAERLDRILGRNALKGHVDDKAGNDDLLRHCIRLAVEARRTVERQTLEQEIALLVVGGAGERLRLAKKDGRFDGMIEEIVREVAAIELSKILKKYGDGLRVEEFADVWEAIERALARPRGLSDGSAGGESLIPRP